MPKIQSGDGRRTPSDLLFGFWYNAARPGPFDGRSRAATPVGAAPIIEGKGTSMSSKNVLLVLLASCLFLFVNSAAADSPKRPSKGLAFLARELPKNGSRWFREGMEWLRQREFVEMILAILDGSQMGPGEGWFHDGQSRYNWNWLAQRCGVDPEDGAITMKEWKGSPELFKRLDRDQSGEITAADFDWSQRSPFVRQTMEASRLFYKFDQNSNGRVSRREWENLFTKLAKGKEYFTPEDLRELFKQPPSAKKKGKDKKGQSGMPSPKVFLKGLLTGELGSFYEGPAIGQRAPAFKLPTHDGTKEIALSQFRGKKPVVLIFGSFT
jgi:hypothetical protein